MRGLKEHIQQDIIVPKIEVTKYIRHYGYCSYCQKVFYPKVDDELLCSYIGPTAKVFAVYLKYKIKVSDRDMADLFCRMFDLSLDPSSISGFRDQLSRAALPLYSELLGDLRKSLYVNANETGWKLDGVNYWLWKFANKKVSITHIDRSRGSKVLFRKITFGNRSPKGIANHSILQSIIQTARLNNIYCYKILKEVLSGKDMERKRLLHSIRSPS